MFGERKREVERVGDFVFVKCPKCGLPFYTRTILKDGICHACREK